MRDPGGRRRFLPAVVLVVLIAAGLTIVAGCERQEERAEPPAAVDSEVVVAEPAQASVPAATENVPDTPTPAGIAPTPATAPTPTGVPLAVTQPVVDFGDAPDGGSAGYVDVAVEAGFPTLAGSGGPRIARAGFETLGLAVSGDDEAKITNADEDDDGVSGMVVSLNSAPPMASVQFDVAVAADAPAISRYVNVLIDLNGDGRWGGIASGGEPEWVVRNQVVDVQPGIVGGMATEDFMFSDGTRLPENAWMRVLLSREMVGGEDWDGGGDFGYGEVEDYLIRVAAGPRFAMRCPEAVSLAGGLIVTVECTVTNFGEAGDAELAFTRELSRDELSRFGGTLAAVGAGEERTVPVLLVKRDAEMGFSYTVGGEATAPGTVLDGVVTPLVIPTDGGFTASEAVPISGGSLADDADDLFHGDPTISPVRRDDSVDTRYWGSGRLMPGTDPAGEIPGADGLFACGQTTAATGATVVCGRGPGAGAHVIVWNSLAAPVPVDDPETVRTYWTMFADSDPNNDFEALPQFANDVLGASDTHYWLGLGRDGVEVAANFRSATGGVRDRRLGGDRGKHRGDGDSRGGIGPAGRSAAGGGGIQRASGRPLRSRGDIGSCARGRGGAGCTRGHVAVDVAVARAGPAGAA